MCIGENNAPQATHYINAQLGALYDNAVGCVERHSKDLRPDDDHKYSFALAEFYYGKHRGRGQASKADMLFYASFGKPSIDFICNHDLILRLNLTEGHYNTDYQKATTELFPASVERNRAFAGLEVLFRVPFVVTGISGRDSRIGNGQHVINMLALELSKAQLISVHPDVEASRSALAFYLTQYLQLLKSAGHHVLFSLPDFDDDRLHVEIDFSTQGQTLLELDEIYGISVEKINAFLSASWLRSAMLASGKKGTVTDRSLLSLAEYRSTWVLNESTEHFHVRLGAPRVKAICNQEVILLFSVDEVLFYDATDFESAQPVKSFTNWEIAVLVNIVHVREENSNVTRLTLDFGTRRFVHAYCDFVGYDAQDEVSVRFWTRLVDFFTTEYLDILFSAQYHVIYHYDIRWPTSFGGITETGEEEHYGEWSGVAHGDGSIKQQTVTKITSWTEIIEQTDMQGFDQILTLTQSAINAYFRTVFTAAQSGKIETTFANWTYNDYFTASFQPLTVRLLSDHKAIVWVHLQEGHLKTLKNWLPWAESERYKFEDWRLAFEVDLKMHAHSSLQGVSESWSTYQDSFIFKHHGGREDRVLKHIFLDLLNADFIHEFSSFEGLLHSQDRRAIDKIQAIVTYIQVYYFPQLVSSGHHILYTIPVWKADVEHPVHALTEAIFDIYSQSTVGRYNWGQITTVNEPAVVILGMCNNRVLPALHLKYVDSWVIRATRGISYGSLALSKTVFLEERLRPLLSRINAITTIVPLPFTIENGEWKLQLTTWADSSIRRGSDSNWVLEKAESGVLKYYWKHLDGWTFMHEGSDSTTNGSYNVLCTTVNTVEIPTVFRSGSLDIKIRGEVSLQLGVKGVKSSWSARSAASWSASVAAYSEVGGLHIHPVGSTVPVFEKSHAEGDVIASLYSDPERLLREHLPTEIDLSGILSEFKTFEGAWSSVYPGTSAYTLAQPVFNRHGDLLFEFRPHSQITATAPAPATPRRVSTPLSPLLHGARSISSSGRPLFSPRPSILQREVSQTISVEESSNGAAYSTATTAQIKVPNGSGNGSALGVQLNPAQKATTTSTRTSETTAVSYVAVGGTTTPR